MSDPRTLEQTLQDCIHRFVRGASLATGAKVTDRGQPAPAPSAPAPDYSTVPRAYRWAALDAPELARRVGRPRAIAEARRAVGASGVLFAGPSGSGKTALACALLRAWADRHPRRRAAFVPAWRLGVARGQHGLGQGEAPEVATALSAPLLVLDDLGSERETTLNAVPDVIFARALAGLPTWVTTWMTQKAVTDRYGDGMARRLYETDRALIIGCGRTA